MLKKHINVGFLSTNTLFQHLAKCKFSVLLIFIFFLPFSSAAVNISLALLIAFWIIEKWQAQDFSFLKRFKVPTICFFIILLCAASSFFYSPNLKETMEGMTKLLKWMLLFYAISDSIRTKSQLSWVIGMWIVSAFLVSLDGLYQYAFGHDLIRHMSIQYFNPGINRIRATYNHATLLAAYLDPILAMFFVLAIFNKRDFCKEATMSFETRFATVSPGHGGLFTWYVIFLLIGVVVATCFLLTWTRIAVISVLLSFLAICFVKRNWIIPGILFMTFSVGYFFLPEKITTWIHSQGNLVQLLFNDDRVWQWKAGINMIKAHPWIGVGVNTFTDQYKNYKIPEDLFDTYYASNSYIQMGAEIGLVALGALFVFIFWLLYRSLKAYFWMKDPGIKNIYLGFWGALLIYFFHGFRDCNLYFSKIAPLFGMLTGCLAASIYFQVEKGDIHDK